MAIKTLKRFQETAIDSAVEVFAYAKSMLDAAGDDAQGRAVAIHDNGYLLIEAPTGSGKTLMAGNIAERMSALDDVVWFWFAPFKGVVDQTAAFLREQFAGLRLRTLSEDRTPVGTRKGDVFVTTWQLVATRAKDKRNVRKTGEQNPSVDDMIVSLREQGLRIGVVVDEAHHGFHGDTQAAEFFRGIVQPEYTILVTATPDDADLADLERRMQAGKIHRVSVSRSDAVGPGPGAGLIKNGIKCVTWKADEGDEGLIDFEATALREAAALHKLLKAELTNIGVSLVPLMLVQVDSKDKSIERAKEKLLALGFTESQIAVHTAAEPDAGLLALANDESKEVLIFKMAVALGFDAPRAWTLVSMRAARDTDFGVQLVGRILRVHRRLQGRLCRRCCGSATCCWPTPRRRRALTPPVSGSIGCTPSMPNSARRPLWSALAVRTGCRSSDRTGRRVSCLFRRQERSGPRRQRMRLASPSRLAPSHPRGEAPLVIGLPLPISAGYRYPLRPDTPRQFKTQDLPEDYAATEADCAAKFVLSAENLLDMLAKHDKVKVQKQTLEIFTRMIQTELAFAAPSPEQMQQLSQRELLRSGFYHPKLLRAMLLTRLQVALADRGVEDAIDLKRLAEYLDVLLATHPELLREAQRKALAEGAIIQEADPLPGEMVSESPLPTSARNVYGVLPPGLNHWEQDFGGLLDSDQGGCVLWWHRNPKQKPWSIKVLLDDGRGFYPDFIVGIQNRKTDRGGLLADTKYAYETTKELPKILAAHESYGRVLILSKNQNRQLAIARMEASGKAVLGAAFSLAEAANY